MFIGENNNTMGVSRSYHTKIVKSICKALSINDEESNRAIQFIRNKSNNLPIDIPDPSFQGPF